MAFDDYPRTQVEVSDGNLRIASVPGSPRVLLLGVTDNTAQALNEPIRVVGNVNIADFDSLDGTPSVLSKAIQEVQDAGADNIEVMVVANRYGAASGKTFNTANPVNILSVDHGLLTGDQVYVHTLSVVDFVEGTYTITKIDADNFTLDGVDNSAGTGGTLSYDSRYPALAYTYDLLLDHDADIVVPVGVFIDTPLGAAANYGWQLANFCYQASVNFNSYVGVIGTEPITAGATISLTELSTWVTAMGIYDTSTVNGTDFVIYDGTTDIGADGIPDNYAFWATSDEAIPTGAPPKEDTEVLTDRNNQPVDIGKYISVVAGQYLFFNELARRADPVNKYYSGDGAAAYAGLITKLKSESAPTNKPIIGPTIIRNPSISQADTLANRRFVVFREGRLGTTVVNAMTGAYKIDDNYRSDFVRLSTMRIVNEAVERVRNVANPFIGEANTGIARQALKAELDQELSKMIERGALQRASSSIISTPTMQVLGQVVIDLVLVPAFEIITITQRVALASS